MSSPYQILARKRRGLSLGADDLAAIVSGASDGTWSEAELAAFLMAAAIRGLDQEETHRLTLAMMQSGDCWDLASDIPGVVDKHSTGGVGDKVSLVLAPLMAAARIPIIMLTGRGLGHTAGTADKLEVIPGLDLELSRARCLEAVEQTGMAIGVATARHRPSGPPSLRAPRPDSHCRLPTSDRCKHTLQEAGHGCRGGRIRCQDG